jgi:hypothetical protein
LISVSFSDPMTPSPELSALMALDALGEATPEQQAELHRLLGAQPGLAEQHKSLRNTANQIDTAAAHEAAPHPMPTHVLHRVEQARESALQRATGNNPSQRRRLFIMLAWAAAIALLAAPFAWMFFQRDTAQPTITLATASPALAPRGETGMTQPTLVWENAPDQDYDVWILPEGANQQTTPALFVANKVRSPVTFATLKSGPANADRSPALKPATGYLALVCLAGQGRLAGVTVPFKTAPAAIGSPPAPSDPSTALTLARQLRDTGRPSDALMVLANLPDAVRHSPDAQALESELRRSLQSTPQPPR